MNKSNIFVYIELSKLVSGLTTNVLLAKNSLRIQSSYFSIIPTKYFSDDLSPEWENILRKIKFHGPLKDEDGTILMNDIVHSIDRLSQLDCVALAMSIINLHQKVMMEFD